VTRPPPARTRAYRSGFTLVEIMVVVFIIAMIITVVGLRGGNARERQALHEEALRLQQLVTLASEEAVLGSRQIGMLFEEDGYRFVLLDGQRWRTLDDDGFLRPRQLPEDISLLLTVEGRRDALVIPGAETGSAAPQILLLSSGESTPFVVELRNRSGEVRRLSVDAVSRPTLLDQDDTP
jgi:general secretion pathway protein H